MNRIILEIDNAIVLKQYTLSDVKSIFQLIDRNRAHLSQYRDTTARNYPEVDLVRKSIADPKNPERLRFGIWDEDIFVGSVNITPDENIQGPLAAEIGYWVGACYQGYGYIGRSVRRLVRYAFDQMRMEQLYATVNEQNVRSANVLMKVGFQEQCVQGGHIIYCLEKS